MTQTLDTARAQLRALTLPNESHGRPASIEVTLPPLGAVVLKPRR